VLLVTAVGKIELPVEARLQVVGPGVRAERDPQILAGQEQPHTLETCQRAGDGEKSEYVVETPAIWSSRHDPRGEQPLDLGSEQQLPAVAIAPHRVIKWTDAEPVPRQHENILFCV